MKKFALLLTIPALAFVLSGCGKKTSPASQVTNSAPKVQNPVPKQTDIPAPPDATTQATEYQKATLPSLPTDDKAAIDSEVNNINKDIDSVDSSTNDLSDAQLGL